MISRLACLREVRADRGVSLWNERGGGRRRVGGGGCSPFSTALIVTFQSTYAHTALLLSKLIRILSATKPAQKQAMAQRGGKDVAPLAQTSSMYLLDDDPGLTDGVAQCEGGRVSSCAQGWT
ncbi:hypothetical protein BHE74_00033574 [Ensete ventricosum]|nr:hypothetical protein BHE74_00033574 [Ensete ventricosum]